MFLKWIRKRRKRKTQSNADFDKRKYYKQLNANVKRKDYPFFSYLPISI